MKIIDAFCFKLLITTINLLESVYSRTFKLTDIDAKLGSHLFYSEKGFLTNLNVEMEIFLSNNEMSLLFYAVDTNRRQYIAEIISGQNINLKVGSYKQEYSMNAICRTTNVQYKKRKFQFVFNPNYLAISCDGHPATVHSVKYNYYKTDTTYVAVVNPKSSEETHFYFVNVPKVSNMHWPYNHQIHGCLYNIKVNDKPINELVDQVILSRGTDNFQECQKSCNQTCKTPGAQCLEYFYPSITKYSCFLADGNGPLCDQRLTMVKSHNYTFTGGKSYLFKRIKYSVNLTTLKETEIFEDKALSLLEMKKHDGINMNITVDLLKSKGNLRVSFKTPQFKMILTTEGLLNVTESPGVYTIYFQIFPDHIVTELIHKHAVINRMKVMLDETIEDFGFSYIRVIAGYFDMAFYYTSFCRIYDLLDFKTQVTTEYFKPDSKAFRQSSNNKEVKIINGRNVTTEQTSNNKEVKIINISSFYVIPLILLTLLLLILSVFTSLMAYQFKKLKYRSYKNNAKRTQDPENLV